MSKGNILYVGQLYEGATSLDRFRCLADLGYSVTAFDTTPYLSWPRRLARSVAHRLNWGTPIKSLNRALTEFAASAPARPDIIWIDKGRWVSPVTLRLIKQETHATAVHYTPDAQFVLHKSHLFSSCGPEYDIAITTKKFELGHYHAAGFRRVLLSEQAYERTRHYPRQLSQATLAKWTSDVLFVGHMESAYLSKLRAVARAYPNVTMRICGPGWHSQLRRDTWLQGRYCGEGVWGDEYSEAIAASSIALGLLSKQLPEEVTTRTFEIPACGGFLLAERTPAHSSVFCEGKEAEFFDGDTELIEKVGFLLAHPARRREMASAGRKRCIQSGYSNHDRLARVIAQL